MSESGRRLAAIMFTDIAGYTSISQRNEALAMNLLEEHRSLVRSLLPRYDGKEIKTMGDAFLVEFPSALEAVRCAFEIQRSIQDKNTQSPSEKKLSLRIGIHLGDVVHTEGDVYGDTVNLASRIEPLASPGGIAVTRPVYEQIKDKVEFPLESLGKKEFKNVAGSMEVFRVAFPWEKSGENKPGLDRRRVAVLPFTNISPDRADEYLAEGMMEELITSLCAVKGLSVIARTSVMRYKNVEKGVSEIARELNVGSLVEGSVRKAGNKVRIAVQLIDAVDEDHLWAQNYDRELDDIFAVQSEIAERVAKELRVQLADSEIRRIEKRPTSDMESYSLYLRGRFYWNERTEEGLRKSLQYFQKAIELDSGFARAYSGMADTWSLMGFENMVTPKESNSKAKAYAERAIELDDSLAEAHTSLAYIIGETDWNTAEREFRKAIELNPSYATAHFWYGIKLLWLHRWDEAIEHSQRAVELDPLSPIISTAEGQALTYARRYDEAIRLLEKRIYAEPENWNMRFILSIAYLYKGLYVQAEKEARANLALRQTWTRQKVVLGSALAREGRKSDAGRVLAEMQAEHAQLSLQALILTELGEEDKALGVLERAQEEGEAGFGWVSVIPGFDPLRSNPRFVDILRKMNLPA